MNLKAERKFACYQGAIIVKELPTSIRKGTDFKLSKKLNQAREHLLLF